jgi:hypothetical protein
MKNTKELLEFLKDCNKQQAAMLEYNKLILGKFEDLDGPYNCRCATSICGHPMG